MLNFLKRKSRKILRNVFNNGKWTASRFTNFVRGALRNASNRWPVKGEVLKEARISRGIYKCQGYKKRWHKAPSSIKIKNKTTRNIYVDHVDPVVDPRTGFTSWDEFIDRLFCEKDNLQVLCKDCHDRKTADERKVRNESRRNSK